MANQLFSPVSASDFFSPERFVSRLRVPFNDARNYSTYLTLGERMFQEQSVVISQLSDGVDESAQYYRFLRNPKVSVPELIKVQSEGMRADVSGRHILVLGDTTSYNLGNHAKRIQNPGEVGVLEDNKTLGFFAHVNLAVDADTKDVLGVADALLWSRAKAPPPSKSDVSDVKGKSPKVKAVVRASDDKESHKWFLGAQNAKSILSESSRITYVFDREADNYELYDSLTKAGDDFVIRVRVDRPVIFEGKKSLISESLASSALLGVYKVDLSALDHYSSTSGKRVKRKARKATIELRSVQVSMLPPANHPDKSLVPIPMRIVEAREVTNAESPIEKGEKLVLWRLATSHSARDYDLAKSVVEYYTCRWMIEQLFRTSKLEGFDLEATELETFQAIQKQTVMTLGASARVLQLIYARERFDSQPIEEVFDTQERHVLEIIDQKFQGTTLEQRNPYPNDQTSWATWIIARLGGWKGYKSQKPPGPTTLKRGLKKFNDYLAAYNLFVAYG